MMVELSSTAAEAKGHALLILIAMCIQLTGLQSAVKPLQHQLQVWSTLLFLLLFCMNSYQYFEQKVVYQYVNADIIMCDTLSVVGCFSRHCLYFCFCFCVDVCAVVRCRKHSECLIHEGTPYCAETCENNGGCSDDKVCELVMEKCETLPCPKQRKCRPRGTWLV